MLRGELFSTDMVRAYLEERKKHTCRPVKPQPPEVSTVLQKDCKFAWSFWPDGPMDHLIRPKHRPGDYIYCRETWRLTDYQYIDGMWSASVQYKADMVYGPRLFWPDGEDNGYERTGWRPSIHMPREAARLFFRVSRVEVIRLEDVTEEFAREDGFLSGETRITGGPWGVEDDPDEWTALDAFKRFWRSTYGDARWMWVYWTELCSKEEVIASEMD